MSRFGPVLKPYPQSELSFSKREKGAVGRSVGRKHLSLVNLTKSPLRGEIRIFLKTQVSAFRDFEFGDFKSLRSPDFLGFWGFGRPKPGFPHGRPQSQSLGFWD